MGGHIMRRQDSQWSKTAPRWVPRNIKDVEDFQLEKQLPPNIKIVSLTTRCLFLGLHYFGNDLYAAGIGRRAAPIHVTASGGDGGQQPDIPRSTRRRRMQQCK
ncbi:unnamed protein product [Heligmosomoides polygyrus]|uniref:40S ribosomal protein S25 n=1 Tax=Heligmosomoides polygyrus TaxID=6339 RepID=A0A183G876_HELPZ|nr:unnamed protein product [Heligmosomoides polygyrus]